MKEVWKRLVYNGVDYGDLYEVSNLGQIRNARNHKVRKLNILQTGYYFVSVSLGDRNHKPTWRVHKAVAETFIPNPNNLPIVNHIDGNKLNNSVDNLEWCTYKDNVKHALDNGLAKPLPCVYHNKLSKLTKEQCEYIYNVYVPYDANFGSRALGKKFGVYHSTILKAYNYMAG